MKWLNLDTIRRQCRIEDNSEDELLEMYGESAEETVLSVLGRSYTELVETFGTDDRPVPAPIVHASLLLVDLSYAQRSPVSQQNMLAVPYAFDMMVKPYMRLSDKSGKEGCV